MSSPRGLYLSILIATVVWCAAVLVAPLLSTPAGKEGITRHGVYGFFHLICHQREDRSFHVFGGPMGVCARCSAIYFGFLAGTLFFPFVRTSPQVSPRIILGVALAPMLVDVGLGMSGLHVINNVSRAATGGFFGLLIPLVVLPPALEGALSFFPHPVTDH